MLLSHCVCSAVTGVCVWGPVWAAISLCLSLAMQLVKQLCVWGWVPNSALAATATSLLASQSLKSRLFIEIENEAKEDCSRLLLPLPLPLALLTTSKQKFALLLSVL